MLAFIDPWGYKGLSLKLVESTLKNWGCDCIFFFNYARINAGLSNPSVQEHMEALFGDQTEKLKQKLCGLESAERESTIVEFLAESLKTFGHRYFLSFCFKNKGGKRTTHYLIFVSKHLKGYEVMKKIMAKQSSEKPQGVPSFQFLPATSSKQGLLFELNRPLEDLQNLLLQYFRGQQKTMKEIYEEHSVDKPYLEKNYRDVLKQMEDKGIIKTSGRKNSRGFPDYLVVEFP